MRRRSPKTRKMPRQKMMLMPWLAPASLLLLRGLKLAAANARSPSPLDYMSMREQTASTNVIFKASKIRTMGVSVPRPSGYWRRCAPSNIGVPEQWE